MLVIAENSPSLRLQEDPTLAWGSSKSSGQVGQDWGLAGARDGTLRSQALQGPSLPLPSAPIKPEVHGETWV